MSTRTGNASGPATPQALTAAEVPVTRAMLGSLRTELLERMDQHRDEARADNMRLDGKIDGVRAELKADIQEVKAELKADIQEVKADIQEVKADVQEVKADIHGVKASMARIELLVEEQNTRNKIVLDGITAVLDRLNQVEERGAMVEDMVRKVVSRSPPTEET